MVLLKQTKEKKNVDVSSTRSVCEVCGTEVAVSAVWDDVAALCSSDKKIWNSRRRTEMDQFLAKPGRKPALTSSLTKGGFWKCSLLPCLEFCL